MANLVALMTLFRHGDEVFADGGSHVILNDAPRSLIGIRPDTAEALARDVGRDLTPLHGLVQSRQPLGTKGASARGTRARLGLDLRAREVEDGAGVDDEPDHRVPQIAVSSTVLGVADTTARARA
jgi:hypothetical protein